MGHCAHTERVYVLSVEYRDAAKLKWINFYKKMEGI